MSAIDPPQKQPRWSGVAQGAVTGVLAPVVAGLMIFTFSPWITETFITQPSCDDPRGLELVTEMTAAADNSLVEQTPRGTLEHGAGNAVDQDSGTAWVEDSPNDPYGRGTSITFQFPSSIDVAMVCVINGYAKSWDLYDTNSRARQWQVETAVGAATAVLADKTVDNYAAFQRLALDAGPTETLRLTIRSIRAGAGNDGADDTSLSEVEVWARP